MSSKKQSIESISLYTPWEQELREKVITCQIVMCIALKTEWGKLFSITKAPGKMIPATQFFDAYELLNAIRGRLEEHMGGDKLPPHNPKKDIIDNSVALVSQYMFTVLGFKLVKVPRGQANGFLYYKVVVADPNVTKNLSAEDTEEERRTLLDSVKERMEHFPDLDKTLG